MPECNEWKDEFEVHRAVMNDMNNNMLHIVLYFVCGGGGGGWKDVF